MDQQPMRVELATSLKGEVQSALEIWANLLQSGFGDNLEYVYTKGSSLKPWDSKIDYVPQISDVDIHYKLSEVNQEVSSAKITKYFEFAKLYEEEYILQNPNYRHMPRMQLMSINKLQEYADYVPPLETDIKILYGSLRLDEQPTTEKIRTLDFQHLLETQDFLQRLPESLIDRTEVELWPTLRTMTWRVSPTPVRILSQFENSNTIWSQNRTTILKLLEKHGFEELRSKYHNFYCLGWELFERKFKDPVLFRSIIETGFQILADAYLWATSYKL